MTARVSEKSAASAVEGVALGVSLSDAMEKTDGQLSGLDRSRVAVLAFCSERTVKRYLDGETVSESTRRRIEGALRKLGVQAARPAESP